MHWKIKQMLLEGYDLHEVSIHFQRSKADIRGVMETFSIPEMDQWEKAKNKRKGKR